MSCLSQEPNFWEKLEGVPAFVLLKQLLSLQSPETVVQLEHMCTMKSLVPDFDFV